MNKTVNLSTKLLDRVVSLTRTDNTDQAVTNALEEFVRYQSEEADTREKQARIIDIFGTLSWNDDFDYKAARSRS